MVSCLLTARLNPAPPLNLFPPLISASGSGAPPSQTSSWSAPQSAPTILKKRRNFCGNPWQTQSLAAVSYTHLDVYKRQGLGMTELKRVSKLLDGRVYPAGVFGTKRAVLVCAEPQYLDLAIGADLSVGYLELKDFNHCFRILETAALRIKNPESIVVFE